MSVEQDTINQLMMAGVGVLIAIPVAISLAGLLIAGFFHLVFQATKEAAGKRKVTNADPEGGAKPKTSGQASFRLCLFLFGTGAAAGGIGAWMISVPGFFVVCAQVVEIFINADFTHREDVESLGHGLMMYGGAIALFASVLYIILRLGLSGMDENDPAAKTDADPS